MSAIHSSSSNSPGWIDHAFKPIAYAKETGAYLFSQDIENPIPNLMQIPYSVVKIFLVYHRSVLQTTWAYGEKVEWVAENLTKLLLCPITFCDLGKRLQEKISEKVVGHLACLVTFCTLQFFHVIPYISASALITGTLFLYQTAPDSLNTLFSGCSTVIMIYFILRLIGEVGVTTKTIDKVSADIDSRINNGIDKIDEKINKVAEKIEGQLNTVAEKIEGKLNNGIELIETKLNEGLTTVIGQVDGIDKSFDSKIIPVVYTTAASLITGSIVVCLNTGSQISGGVVGLSAAVAYLAYTFWPTKTPPKSPACNGLANKTVLPVHPARPRAVSDPH